MLSDSVYVLYISKERSSLIHRIEYNEDTLLLYVYVNYSKNPFVYEGVHRNHFLEFTQQKSIGRYYLNYIKPNFLQVKTNFMAERPKTKNKASAEVRWIDMSINVREIKKEWITPGEKGDYLNFKLRMLPDGETDKYGNLGMLVQSVPSQLYKEAEAKQKGSGKDIKGVILGNAAELDWGNVNKEGMPGGNNLPLPESPLEDLPF